MSLFGWVRPKAPSPRQEPSLGAVGAQIIGGYSRVPARRDTRALLAAYAHSPLLQSIARKVAFAVASTEWHVVWLAGDGTEQPVPDHPLAELMRHGNGSLSGLQCTILEELGLLLAGEAFSVLDRNIAGVPVRRWPIPADWVTAVATPGWPYFQITPRNGGQPMTLPRADVLWQREVDPLHPYERGAGIGRSLDDELSADEAAAQHMAATLRNRAMPETIISGTEAAPLLADGVARMQAVFEDRFGGPTRAGKPLFTSGPVNVQTLTPSFRELDLTRLREFERDAIIQAFGIPPEMIGKVDNSSRAHIESAEFFFTKHLVLPRLVSRRSAINDQLAPQYGDGIRARFESPVDEDREFRAQVMRDHPDAFTIDEHRALAGLSPLPDGAGERFPLRFSTIYGQHAAQDTAAEAQPQARAVAKMAPGEIDRLTGGLGDDAFLDVLEAGIRGAVAEFAAAAFEDIGVSIAFDVFDPRVSRDIRGRAADASRLIVGTTREALRVTLAEGVEAGENTAKLVARIREAVVGASPTRARMISRTEIVRASNYATTEAHREAGIAEREWLATQDDRVREAHAALDGQRAGINEPFTVDGARGMYPGGFGVAALDVNCRCGVLPVMPAEITGRAADEWRRKAWDAVERRRGRHERLMERQLLARFDRVARDLSRLLKEMDNG